MKIRFERTPPDGRLAQGCTIWLTFSAWTFRSARHDFTWFLPFASWYPLSVRDRVRWWGAVSYHAGD